MKKYFKKIFTKNNLSLMSKLFLIAACAFMIGFFKTYHLPQIKHWLLIKVETQSQNHTPVRVWPKNVEIQLFPPGVKFTDVRILPQKNLKKYTAPMHIKSFEVNISLLGLVQGQIRASRVILSEPTLSFVFKQKISQFIESLKDSSPEKNDSKFKLDSVFNLPIDRLEIKKLDLLSKFSKNNTAIKLEDLDISIENKYKSLLVKSNLPNLIIKQLGNRPNLNLILNSKFLVESTGIQISSLKLKVNNSFLVASGKLDGNLEEQKFSNLEMSSRLFWNLPDIRNATDVFLEENPFPEISGNVGSDVNINYDFVKNIASGSYSIETKKLFIDRRLVGEFRSTGLFNNNKINADNFSISNVTGSAKLDNLQLHLNDKKSLKFDAVAKIETLKIQPFLKSLRVGTSDIPVQSTLKGRLPCKGELLPKILITCDGSVSSENLHIYTDSESNEQTTILKVNNLSAVGDVIVDSKKVKYSANLTGGKKSRGSSKGIISYKKGFDIGFIGERVDFEDVDDLLGLDLQGSVALQGSTKGTSEVGTVNMNIRGKKLWIKDYGLGNVDSELRYKDGKLTFRKMKGQFLSSLYSGNLIIDVRKNELFLNHKLSFIELNDVQKLLSKKFELPISVLGTGSGSIKAWGPLDFKYMSYELNSAFYRGRIAKETFDNAKVVIKSKDGVVGFTDVHINKANSRLNLKGSILPSGDIDAVVIGRNFRLEQSENVSTAGLDLVGEIDSTLSLKGQLPEPEILLNGRLRNLVIGDSPAEDSSFQVNIMKDRINGKLNFIGQTVQSTFIFPYENSAPFFLDISTNQWDFTNLFSLFSKTAKRKDFKTQLTSTVRLKSQKGGFWNSTGLVEVNSFSVQRGPLSMSSSGPMKLHFKNGSINSDNFNLKGNASFLKLDLINSNKNNLRTEINGKIDLSLAALFTPFLEDLRGTLSLAVEAEGSFARPSFVGSAFVQNGYVKIEEFPHPFDQINADLLFNQKSILINALKANLGGGTVKGEGKISVQSLKTVPIEVRAQFNDISLNIPDGMRTTGSGNIDISGNRFPYLLKGKYDVSRGDVTMDFSPGEAKANEIKPSEFLPQFLTKNSFQPLRFDLSINLAKPVNIKNELIDAQARGQLQIVGTPDSLKLDGTITPLRGGILNFKDIEFEVLSGYVDYRNAFPENPAVNLRAQSKVTETIINPQTQREESTDYDVDMLVEGVAPDVKINLESRPPLSYNQIVSLLALGMTTTNTIDENYDPSQSNSTDSSLASGVIGTQLGNLLIGKQLSEPIKERLGVDLKISSSTNTTENATYPKLTFSKQWTPKWETSASRTIENNPKSDVKVEYKLNNSLSFIGLWEGREQTNASEEQEIEEDKVGLDVEYKVNFK